MQAHASGHWSWRLSSNKYTCEASTFRPSLCIVIDIRLASAEQHPTAMQVTMVVFVIGTRASATEQAVGRLVGAMCAITARDGDAQSAMLASWISQVLPQDLQNEEIEAYGLRL